MTVVSVPELLVGKLMALLELLFPDQPVEVARLAGHPALQWKLANVRRNVQGK